jgi:hypothetical protein
MIIQDSETAWLCRDNPPSLCELWRDKQSGKILRFSGMTSSQ